MANTRLADKKAIDLSATTAALALSVLRQFVVPLCVIKSNAKPGIKLLATLFCWLDASAVRSIIKESKKETYKMFSIEE